MVLLDAELFYKYLSFVHAFKFITSIFLSLFAGIFVSILAILSQIYFGCHVRHARMALKSERPTLSAMLPQALESAASNTIFILLW